MGLLGKWWRTLGGSNRSGEVRISGQHLTSASGALVAPVAYDHPGYTLTKVGSEAGRYLVQFVDEKGLPVTFRRLTGFNATILTDDADAAYPATNAQGAHVRNNTAALTTLHTNGQLLVQFTRDDTHADAEVADGCGFLLEFWLKTNSALP